MQIVNSNAVRFLLFLKKNPCIIFVIYRENEYNNLHSNSVTIWLLIFQTPCIFQNMFKLSNSN